jgi:hypothetical protein
MRGTSRPVSQPQVAMDESAINPLYEVEEEFCLSPGRFRRLGGQAVAKDVGLVRCVEIAVTKTPPAAPHFRLETPVIR